MSITVGQQVKAAREALGLTQTKLAELAGVPQQKIANIESGYNVTLVTLVKVANGLAASAGRGNTIVLRVESGIEEPGGKPWEGPKEKSTAPPK